MYKILLVDDSKLIRATVKAMLVENGYEIIGEATNGKDAIKKYKELLPDLVLMDVIMPQENGIEAARKIVSLDENAKVLLMSTEVNAWRMNEAILAGAKEYVSKPIKKDELLGKVRGILG